MILSSMLPERSADDIAAERIRLTFGVEGDQREVVLHVLPIVANREWVAQLEAKLGGVWDNLDDLDASQVTSWLLQRGDDMLELLRAYDQRQALPEEPWFSENVTDRQVLVAFLGVAAAAHPLAVSVIDALSRSEDLSRLVSMAMVQVFSKPTSSPPASTAGSRKKSKKR